MKFEVPICEVDFGDEFEQLLFNYFGDSYSPPAKSKAMAGAKATSILSSVPKVTPKFSFGGPTTDIEK